jgi:hypothetical protein
MRCLSDNIGDNSPRLRYAGRPSLSQARKRVIYYDHPLSAEGEERVVERSKDRVSNSRQITNDIMTNDPMTN